jgi:hypothetical protein
MDGEQRPGERAVLALSVLWSSHGARLGFPTDGYFDAEQPSGRGIRARWGGYDNPDRPPVSCRKFAFRALAYGELSFATLRPDHVRSPVIS